MHLNFDICHFFPKKIRVYIAISQSGETADTLEALRLINSMDLPTIALTNVPSSTHGARSRWIFIDASGARNCRCFNQSIFNTNCALYWLAHRIALEKGIINQAQMEIAEEDLLVAAEVLENSIENYKRDIVHTSGTNIFAI